MLRDIIRQLSDIYRKNVALIDERCEIAACVNGVPCNDIGRTDVLDGCNKLTGVYMAVRSLSPQVVAMDEIGGEDDIKALLNPFFPKRPASLSSVSYIPLPCAVPITAQPLLMQYFTALISSSPPISSIATT